MRCNAILLVFCYFSITIISSQNVPFYIPFYDQSANGFTMPARGWNSWGLQANPSLWSFSGFSFVDAHFRQQCSKIIIQQGYDYYCSLDSGWSVGGNGDEFGRIIPDTSVIPNISDLANFLHSKGLLLGIYVIPGAFNADANKLVYNTNTQIGSLFNTTQDPSGKTCNNYFARTNFDYSLNGVQQWHNSVVNLFASWYVLMHLVYVYVLIFVRGIDFIKLDFITPRSPQGLFFTLFYKLLIIVYCLLLLIYFNNY